MKNQHEVEKLAYAMTRQRYLLNRDIVHDLFTELSLSDYIALHSIAEAAGQGGSAEQTYLRDLAERLEMPIPKTSKMIRKLHDRGLVFWSHSGDGRDGTYVVITDSGVRAMARQANILNAYYAGNRDLRLRKSEEPSGADFPSGGRYERSIYERSGQPWT